jgi:hypothetical protein
LTFCAKQLTSQAKEGTKIKLRAPLCSLWLIAVIWACHPVSCHPTISHDFPQAEQTGVVPGQPQARAAVRIDALPAAVAARTDVALARVEAAECTYYVPSSVAEQA